MKTLIAYYSRTGNNKRLARELEEKLSSHKEVEVEGEEIIDLEDRKGPIGFLKGGFQAARKKKARIKPVKKDPSEYDLVIIVSPIWVGVLPPAMRTYLEENQFPGIAFLSVSGQADSQKTIGEIQSLTDKKPVETLVISGKQFSQGKHRTKLKEFVGELGKRD